MPGAVPNGVMASGQRRWCPEMGRAPPRAIRERCRHPRRPRSGPGEPKRGQWPAIVPIRSRGSLRRETLAASQGRAMTGPVDIFIIFARADALLYAELDKHLALLKRQGVIRSYSAADIRPGEEWRAILRSKAASAKIILLLVSSESISSKTCIDLEAKSIERHKLGEAVVIPVICKPCDWESSELGRLKPLPDNGRPVTTWSSPDEAWLNVVQGLRRTLAAVAVNSRPHAPPAAPQPVTTEPIRVLPVHPLPYPPTRMEPPVRVTPAGSDPGRALPPLHRHSAPSYPGVAHSPSRASAISYPHVVVTDPFSRSSGVPIQAAGRVTIPTPPPSASPSRQRTHRWRGPLLLLGALVTVGLLAQGSSLWEGPPVQRDTQWPVPTARPAGPSTAAPMSQPAGTSACGPPCCGGEACRTDSQNTNRSSCAGGSVICQRCPSGRTCVPGKCSIRLEPTRPFQLRLADVVLSSKQRVPTEGEVCVRSSGADTDWTCTPYAEAADLPTAPPGGGMRTRLPITMSDLMSAHGIDIEVRVDGVPLAVAARASHPFLLTTALCQGVKFPISSTPGLLVSTPVGNAMFYLDDP